MRNYPVRLTLLFVLGWAIAMLLTARANSQIIVSTADGPVGRPLPKVIQAMTDAEYANWAKWHNALAERYAAQKNDAQDRYYKGWRTITSGQASTNGRYDRYRDRNGEFTYDSSQTRYGGTSVTVPMNIPNPNYCPKSVMYYNPHCRPAVTSDLVPDWKNIFFLLPDGQVMSVDEFIKTAPAGVRVSCEWLYAEIMIQSMVPPQTKPTQKPKKLFKSV